ncbi:MAG: response regulator [Candidatus Cloacimonadaceae bacterium]|nr:response regulator [Candidatus Cloacimonadota bacterium]MDY0126757.1 response regulator [Candidatus Cloacimonadaceae bacterium]MCB5255366.1 response regulator [Candidatus Cloacimonadota bacterium]MCK9242107.1 response regulator [Candidatus Cloacimonadota bacterium]MDD3103608.1 response regulator [Candidatus Cloacimonadota bacterium]
MRISSRLLLLFIVIAVVFGAFFYMFYYIKHEEMRLYREADLSQRRVTIDGILQIKSEAQMKQTQDYAFGNGILTCMQNPHSDAAKSKLQKIISDHGFSLAQIYSRSGDGLCSVADEGSPGLSLFQLEPAFIDSLVKLRQASFFQNFHHQVLSCTVSSIPPSSDSQRPPAGYLLIAKVWDYRILSELATALNYDIRISEEKQVPAVDEGQYNTKIIRPLLGPNREAVAWLIFYSSNPFLNQLRNLGNLILFGTMGFIFVFLLMQYFLIQQWIATPLNLISQSLKQNVPDPIIDLKKGDNEFSDIAQLIERFFAQKEELIKEVQQRTESEERLRELEEQTRKILLTSPESIIVTELDGTIIDVNTETLNLLQIPDRDDFLTYGPKIDSLIRKDERSQVLAILNELKKGSYVKNRNIYLQLKENHGFPGLLSASVILDNSGQASKFIFVTRDITDIRNLEQQLRQSQKMESIGTLAGGIAHDFNNIITIIAGYIALASGKIGKHTQADHDLSAALKACLRAKSLIGKILTFSRQSEQDMEDLCLKDIIEESLPMIRALLPANIKIKTDIASEAYTTADNTELQQVLINLSTNAYHAMRPDGGTLSIELNETHAQKLMGLSPDINTKSRYLHLSVSDTGSGIAPEIITRIFDPYFSTKSSGEGTGLGLSIVHGIITGYKGFISLRSVLGEGTNVNLYLPINENPTKKIKPPRTTDSPFIPARLMIVDDEPALTDIFYEALQDAGYSVEAYTDAFEALAAFKKNPAAYDLVIADISMPGMDGIKLSTKITAIKDLTIVLYTGFLDLRLQNKAEEAGIKYILNKPIMPDNLIMEIKRIIYTESGNKLSSN